MRSLDYGDAARRSLISIFRHIADHGGGPVVATRFVVSLRSKCADIARLPGTIGKARAEIAPDLRSLAFKSYVIFFRYANDTVQVVDIVHGQRDIAAYFADDPTR